MGRLNCKAYTLVTAPAVEPVTIDEVKAYAKIDGSQDDSLLTLLITTARQAAESYTKRSFITQTWEMTADYFGEFYSDDYPPFIAATMGGLQTIQLSRGPWQTVESIKSINPYNDESTVSAPTYTLDKPNGRIMLNTGYTWPTDLRYSSAVKVQFKAGYGDAATDVPAPIRQAILQHAVALYETRCQEMSQPVTSMLDPYRLPEGFGAW